MRTPRGAGTIQSKDSPPSALLNSLNEINGTTQRFSTSSQLRVFRSGVADISRAGLRIHPQEFLEVWLLALGAQLISVFRRSINQRFLPRRHALTVHSSRMPPAVATKDRSVVRETTGMSGRLPVVSRIAPVNTMTGACPLVML